MFRTVLSLFRARPKALRLRHVLAAGLLMEQKAEEFYRRCADRAGMIRTRALCLNLAEDEAGHQRLIRGILSRWRTVETRPSDLRAIGAEMKIARLFVSPPAAGATPEEVLAFAIAAEQKMVRFYSDFAAELRGFLSRERKGGSADPRDEARALWKGVKLDAMVEEERGHVRKLSEQLSRR